MCVSTVVAKVALRFLVLDGDEGPNEVVDNGCDQHKQQEDLGLHGTRTWLRIVLSCIIPTMDPIAQGVQLKHSVTPNWDKVSL